MSIKDCITRSQQAGEITLEEAQRLSRRFDDLFKHLRSASAAKEGLINEITAEAAEKKRRALLTESVRQERFNELIAHRNGRGQQDIAEAFFYMHEHHGQARVEDVEHRKLTITAGAHARLDELLFEFRRGALKGDLRRRGGQTKARLDNVVRELFGEGTGDEAAARLAQAWTEVAEDLRQRFNAAGGAIGKLEKWGLPQWHDPEALLNFGRAAWIEHITPLLDRERMKSPLTGMRLTDAEIRESLGVAWDRITSDGWIDREPSMQPMGRGAVFRQHADHRFLHFKDADTWLRYARDFGGGDPFNGMMGHISTMARDIASMEMFGPNPEMMRNYLKQVVEKHAATVKPIDRIIAEKTERLSAIKDKLAQKTQDVVARIEAIPGEIRRLRAKRFDMTSRRNKKKITELEEEFRYLLRRLEPGDEVVLRDAALEAEYQAARAELESIARVPFADTNNPLAHASATLSKADDMWAVLRGTASAPVDSRVANTLNTLRQVITAASLGSAQLSAVSDVAFNKATRAFVGLPSSVTGIIGGYVRSFSRANRREAVRAGLILDSATHVMQQQARYTGSMNTGTISGFLADRVIALQGLAAWTQAGKHAFGLAMQAELADRVGMALADLPDALRRTLERHGITAAEWDQIRASRLYEPESGATFLRPNEIAASAGRRVAEKYLAMILRETRFAVPEPTVRSRILLTAGARPGTFVGELARSATQFKSFGVAVIMMHGGRVAREIGAGRGARGAYYAGAVLITGGLLGALALQLKALKDGQDPRDMLDPAFWGAALLQGGGLGIYGDFLFAGVNRFGGGLTGTVAGPLVGRADQLRNRTIGNVYETLEEGGPNNLGRELVSTIKDWTPGGSLWYAKLAYERVLLDQLQHLLDPDARRAFRRKVKQRQKDYGNGFWWAPGEAAPARAPDLSSAVGGR